MSIYLNDYDIERAYRKAEEGETPILLRGIEILERLVAWTDRNSDGWPYWQKPKQAAQKLMLLIAGATDGFGPYDDITEADLKKALTPIKSFLTKQGVEHALILDGPPPPPCQHPADSIRENYLYEPGFTCIDCKQKVRPLVWTTA